MQGKSTKHVKTPHNEIDPVTFLLSRATDQYRGGDEGIAATSQYDSRCVSIVAEERKVTKAYALLLFCAYALQRKLLL